MCGQVRSEALAAAQERLEATKVALERRRDELRLLEREVREAARSADASGKAAAARNAELLRKEVRFHPFHPPAVVLKCQRPLKRLSAVPQTNPVVFGAQESRVHRLILPQMVIEPSKSITVLVSEAAGKRTTAALQSGSLELQEGCKFPGTVSMRGAQSDLDSYRGLQEMQAEREAALAREKAAIEQESQQLASQREQLAQHSAKVSLSRPLIRHLHIQRIFLLICLVLTWW